MEQSEKLKTGSLQCCASPTSHLIVPLEVRRDRELHFQRGARDWLQVHGQVQFRELVHVLVDSLAHFWHADELAWQEGGF